MKLPTLNILIADDQEEIRTLTSHQLTRAGHRVVAVANGMEAVKAAQQVRFDVALLDEEMPVMGGVEAARGIRQQASESVPSPLLVAVTANATAQDRERLLAVGFDHVVGKPFRLEALDSIFAGVPANASETIHPHGSVAADEDPIDVLSRRVNGDRNLMRKLTASFLRDLPSRMNSLRRALKRGDAGEVGALAHALKGTVAIFGASQARARSEELQNLGRSGDLQPAHSVFESLQADVAQLERKLRGYAKPAKVVQRAKGRSRPQPSGRRTKKQK
jgi:CheY-like chemotaxis protein